jgi:integrase
MSNSKIGRVAKVVAFAKRAGTPGEREAAEAALVRIGDGAPPPRTAAPRTTHLADAIVKQLPLPARGYSIAWDDDVPGFGCRVTTAGARSFIFNYRVKGSGQERRITIGAAGNWSTGAARNEAKRLRRLVDAGGDPRGELEEQREAATVADLCDRFEREQLPKRRPSTIRTYRGMLDKHIKPHFGNHTKVADVAYADVEALHHKVTATGSTYVANRCVAVCSRMFSLAIKWQMRPDNPCRGIERNPESKRRRYLSGDELKRLIAALAKTPDKQFVNIVSLLVLTGARRGEVLGMRWDDLTLVKDKGVWAKLGSTTKQKTDHIVPLSAPACLLLAKIKKRGEYVFPSSDNASGHIVEIKNGWAALCERAGIEGLRTHDLRHSFASQLASQPGASLLLIGTLLGHSNPSTTARYSHLFVDPQRAAVEKVGAIVNNAGKGAG